MTTDLLNTPEAAKALRMGTATLQRWRKAKKGPPYLEVGRKVFYRAADLEHWLTAQKHHFSEEARP
jgi:predicted DNA-binding transcriptional regulator AlpA